MEVDGNRHAPGALLPGVKPGTRCVGGWVGPRASVEGCGKFCHHWHFFVSSLCTLSVVLCPHFPGVRLLSLLYNTHNTNIHSPRRDSNPQSQQTIGRRPSPWTARPLGSPRLAKTIVNNELERVRKEVVVASFDVLRYPVIS